MHVGLFRCVSDRVSVDDFLPAPIKQSLCRLDSTVSRAPRLRYVGSLFLCDSIAHRLLANAACFPLSLHLTVAQVTPSLPPRQQRLGVPKVSVQVCCACNSLCVLHCAPYSPASHTHTHLHTYLHTYTHIRTQSDPTFHCC